MWRKGKWKLWFSLFLPQLSLHFPPFPSHLRCHIVLSVWSIIALCFFVCPIISCLLQLAYSHFSSLFCALNHYYHFLCFIFILYALWFNATNSFMLLLLLVCICFIIFNYGKCTGWYVELVFISGLNDQKSTMTKREKLTNMSTN